MYTPRYCQVTNFVDFSSLPLRYYDQDHCQRLEIMKMFYKMNNCRVLPLYGTLDLVSNDTMPICGREAMWTMMPMLRMRSSNPDMDAMMAEAESRCPRDCWQEKIDMQMSFTILSDENFEKAWKIWPLPPNRTKFDAVFMELFYTTLAAEVILF